MSSPKKIKIIQIQAVPFTAWRMGVITVISTLDHFQSPVTVLANFGTTEMPTGWYKHTSLAHPSRLPTWEELKEVKEEFHGDVFVFQALPPSAVYINVHNYCFHLWEYLGTQINPTTQKIGPRN